MSVLFVVEHIPWDTDHWSGTKCLTMRLVIGFKRYDSNAKITFGMCNFLGHSESNII
jgi:hypothetical protein